MLIRKYKISWFGAMGCGYPTDDNYVCMAYCKRHAHRLFINFLGENINRQYTCSEKLKSFKEISKDIEEIK